MLSLSFFFLPISFYLLFFGIAENPIQSFANARQVPTTEIPFPTLLFIFFFFFLNSTCA
jgi:hypothetical protein